MSTDERARHELHAKLEHAIGTEEAATLMSYLPPVGWADVTTKHDLGNVRRDVDLVRRDVDLVRRDVDLVRRDISELRSDSAAQVRTFMLATSASVLTTASLAFAAARFA